MAQADLIIFNGLFLEEPTLALAKANKKAETLILSLGEQAITRDAWQFDFTFPETAGHPNPHLWPDPNLGLRYAELVHDQLVAMDPDNAGYYGENLERFRDRVIQMDQAIRAAVATVPYRNRKLLTYHDSWAYFAKQYGLEVIGAVQPSNFSQYTGINNRPLLICMMLSHMMFPSYLGHITTGSLQVLPSSSE